MSPLFFSCRGMVKITEGYGIKTVGGYGENNGTKYRLLNKIDY